MHNLPDLKRLQFAPTFAELFRIRITIIDVVANVTLCSMIPTHMCN